MEKKIDEVQNPPKPVQEPGTSSQPIDDLNTNSSEPLGYLLQFSLISLIQLKLSRSTTVEIRHTNIFGFVWIYINPEHSSINDTTIEERVTILEFQMAGLTEEVIDLGDELDVSDGEIAVIFADQVIQDERILEVEADSEGELTCALLKLP